jgi:hypothetical protein
MTIVKQPFTAKTEIAIIHFVLFPNEIPSIRVSSAKNP